MTGVIEPVTIRGTSRCRRRLHHDQTHQGIIVQPSFQLAVPIQGGRSTPLINRDLQSRRSVSRASRPSRLQIQPAKILIVDWSGQLSPATLTAAGLPALSLHGLRRSVGTPAEWMECPAGVSAQITGHKPSAIAENTTAAGFSTCCASGTRRLKAGVNGGGNSRKSGAVALAAELVGVL